MADSVKPPVVCALKRQHGIPFTDFLKCVKGHYLCSPAKAIAISIARMRLNIFFSKWTYFLWKQFRNCFYSLSLSTEGEFSQTVALSFQILNLTQAIVLVPVFDLLTCREKWQPHCIECILCVLRLWRFCLFFCPHFLLILHPIPCLLFSLISYLFALFGCMILCSHIVWSRQGRNVFLNDISQGTVLFFGSYI